MKYKFTQKELKNLGFQRRHISFEESGGEPCTYYIFEFDKNNYTNCLISGEFEKDVEEVGVSFFEGDRNLSEKFVKTLIEEFK